MQLRHNLIELFEMDILYFQLVPSHYLIGQPFTEPLPHADSVCEDEKDVNKAKMELSLTSVLKRSLYPCDISYFISHISIKIKTLSGQFHLPIHAVHHGASHPLHLGAPRSSLTPIGAFLSS